jgi:hypothetical protein
MFRSDLCVIHNASLVHPGHMQCHKGTECLVFERKVVKPAHDEKIDMQYVFNVRGLKLRERKKKGRDLRMPLVRNSGWCAFHETGRRPHTSRSHFFIKF